MEERQQSIQQLEEQFSGLLKEREPKELIRSEEAKKKEDEYFKRALQQRKVEVDKAKALDHVIGLISNVYQSHGFDIGGAAPYALAVLYGITGVEKIREAPIRVLNHSYALRLGKTKERVLEARKGVCIVGSVGTGKTFMIDTIRKTCNSVQKVIPAFGMGKMYHAKDICKGFSKDGASFLDLISKNSIVIDDLGTDTYVSNFGNKINPIEDLIQQERYQLFQKGVLTHFTTNLSVEELQDKYDKRTIDRLKEMCNFIEISNGKSFR